MQTTSLLERVGVSFLSPWSPSFAEWKTFAWRLFARTCTNSDTRKARLDLLVLGRVFDRARVTNLFDLCVHRFDSIVGVGMRAEKLRALAASFGSRLLKEAGDAGGVVVGGADINDSILVCIALMRPIVAE